MSQLTNNTTELQAILDAVNALPEATGDPVLQEKTATPGASAQEITPDSGYDGLSKVTVDPIPEDYIIPEGTLEITENGTHDVAGYASASVNVPTPDPVLQSKTVSPTTSAQTVKPDSGYDGLSKVTVNAMPTATQATPSISVSSAGLITASATQTAGYVAAGTKSATKQLTVQAAQTITPGTSDKTIASGRYLTGTQTIKGDPNLTAPNIAEGVSIFGVTGTHTGGEDVSAETAEYTGLLDDLETAIDALPDAESGGGGGQLGPEWVDVTDSFDVYIHDYCGGGIAVSSTSFYFSGSGILYEDCIVDVTADYGSGFMEAMAMAHRGAVITLISDNPLYGIECTDGLRVAASGELPSGGYVAMVICSLSYNGTDPLQITIRPA